VLDRETGPRVRGLRRLEEVQNVLCARGRPQSQKPMVRVREPPPSAEGDETRVAVLGKDHRSTVRDRTGPAYYGRLLYMVRHNIRFDCASLRQLRLRQVAATLD
jgi:hypothetical protein